MLEHIEKRGRTISKFERERKLDEFKKLKERIAKITKKKELNQEEFDSYVKSLDVDDSCKYSLGIRKVICLCNNALFKCEFRSQDKYNFGLGLRFECRRERMLRLRNLL
ncbi:MAG: hypothetical protein JSW18_05920 [Candidatus Omnitrophota bacterium]|nr:MAG: hypothetical protein JSW18_05920 [Candidatus Omnitrophota bacterium]